MGVQGPSGVQPASDPPAPACPAPSGSHIKSRIKAALVKADKLNQGQLTHTHIKSDPDRPPQHLGDTAISPDRAVDQARASSSPDALGLMPLIPPSTSGLVSPDEGTQRQQHQVHWNSALSSPPSLAYVGVSSAVSILLHVLSGPVQ